MKTLIAFEFKKLLNRKAVWVALALGLALFAYGESSTIDNNEQGYRAVYKRYEGQIITEAFKTQIAQDFNQYVLAHMDSFVKPAPSEGEQGVRGDYFPSEAASEYDGGVWCAYQDLNSAHSLEDEQKYYLEKKEIVATGKNENGVLLTPFELRDFQNMVRDGVQTPVVHYCRGWADTLNPTESMLQMGGIYTMTCAGLILLGLFNGETSAHMEPLLLTAKLRRRAVWAKLWVGAIVTLGIAALFFGLQNAVSLGVWGADGANLPADTASNITGRSPMTIGTAYTLCMLFLLAMAGACGAIVAWASARFRNPLATLLAAGSILAGMAIVQDTWANNLYRFAYAPWVDAVNNALLLLPSVALIQTTSLPWRAYTMPWPLLELGAPLAMMALFFSLAYRAFLRRRRA